MANVKISNLTAATTPVAGTEVLPIVQSGATVKVSIANLTAGRSVSATGLALAGSTSGTVTLAAKAVAGSTTFRLPAADGTSGQFMSTDGSGNLSFASASASQWTTTGSDIYYTTGKVGIGTATPAYNLDVARSGNGVSARFSQGSFFAYIYSGSAASYFSADTGALTSYGLAASTLSMSAGNGGDQLVVSQTSVKPNVLLDISGASAGQIKFPATQNASSDANTLDDYEEGTYTPTFPSMTVNSGSAVYSGKYTKIGNLCYAVFGTTGTQNITAVAGTTQFTVPFAASAIAFTAGLGSGPGLAQNGNTTATSGLQGPGNGASNGFFIQGIAATSSIVGTITYQTA